MSIITIGLSFLAFSDSNAEIRGLESFDEQMWPPVPIVHDAFQAMVAIGTGLLVLAVYSMGGWVLRRCTPTNRPFLVVDLLSGPLAAVALEAGWIVTEGGYSRLPTSNFARRRGIIWP